MTDNARIAISHHDLQQMVTRKLRNMNYLAVLQEMPVKWGRRRVDVIGLRSPADVRIVEVKANRTDFDRDNKWEGYLPWCTRFAFAYPEGMIDPAELPKEVGLLEYRGGGGLYPGYLYWARGCRKAPEMNLKIYANLMRGLLGRFNSIQREAALEKGACERHIRKLEAEIRLSQDGGEDEELIHHAWRLSGYTSPSGKIMYHCPICLAWTAGPVKPKFETAPCEPHKYRDDFEVCIATKTVRAAFGMAANDDQ